MRLAQIGSPIFPMPTKPIFCTRKLLSPLSRAALGNCCGTVREVRRDTQRAFHHGPRLNLERTDAVGNEWVAQSDLARLLFAGGADNRHSVTARAVAERAGCKQLSLFLELDHV